MQHDSSAFVHGANNIENRPADWDLVCWAHCCVVAGVDAKKESLGGEILASMILQQKPHDWVSMPTVL